MAADADRAASLAAALRAHRRAAGLSQELLAERSGVSVRTIRNLENGRVTAPRWDSARRLAEALGVDSDEWMRFCQLRAEDKPRTSPGGHGAPAGTPVPLTRLVGRAADVAALAERLSASTVSLVTLTGVAGVGKSRLAIEVVRQLQERGRRAWWVSLAPVGDAHYALDAVARAVGAAEVSPSAVASRIGPGPALLAVDNLEHLDGLGDLLVDLLGLSPSLSVLATSRSPVGVPGEQEWPVRPLATPPHGVADPSALASVDSVQLLVERVRAVIPAFELTPANGSQVAEICRLLDGLPLAIELAAKQWRVRGGPSLAQFLRRDPLALRDISTSDSPEHASLLDALDASYELLGNDERRAFEGLSAFPAGWGIDAAEFMVGGEAAAVDHLDRLVALGLVVASAGESTDEPRFSMLPTIRAFATTRAHDAGTAEAAAALHAEYFHRWMVEVTAAGEPPWPLLEVERDNLRTALGWFRVHDPRAGLELALCLYHHWSGRGREAEGLAHMEALLARAQEAHVDDLRLMGTAQQRAAILTYAAGRYQVAGRLAATSLAAYRALDDPRGCAEALGALGMAMLVSDPHASIAHCQAALALAEPLGDAELLARLMERLSLALSQLGRLDEATAAAERALTVAREHQLPRLEVRALLARAFVCVLRGDYVAADRIFTSGSPVAAALGDARLEASWLSFQAITSAHLGALDRAADLVAAMSSSAEQTGSSVIATLADLTTVEPKLLVGAPAEALAALRRAGANPPLGLPLNRIMWLTLMAAAAADVETAARAVGTATSIADRLRVRIPPVLAARLDATRDWWVSAVGTDSWTDQVAAASERAVDDVVRDLLEPSGAAKECR